MTAPRIFTDFRKTALIAGAGISLSVLGRFVARLLTFPNRSSMDLIASTLLFLVILALELAMPVLLLLLYRTGIRPSLSRRQQYVIMALIAVLSVSLLIFLWGEWRSGILPNSGSRALLAKTDAWFLLSPAGRLWAVTHAISTALDLVSRLLTILFLAAFAKRSEPHTMPAGAAAHQVRKAAVFAITAQALMMTIGVLSYMVYANGMRTYRGAGVTPGVLPTLRNMLFELPALIVPWIIYRSIGKPEVADPA